MGLYKGNTRNLATAGLYRESAMELINLVQKTDLPLQVGCRTRMVRRRQSLSRAFYYGSGRFHSSCALSLHASNLIWSSEPLKRTRLTASECIDTELGH
jgi:hypothetical protein